MTDDVTALPLERKAALLSGRDFWSTAPVEEAGLPSVVRMSQNMRAERSGPPHGRIWKVEASGRTIMSSSLTRVSPSMADPSKPMPSLNAPSSSAGAIDTDLSVPSTSENQSLTDWMSCSSIVRSANSCCSSMVASLTYLRRAR